MLSCKTENIHRMSDLYNTAHTHVTEVNKTTIKTNLERDR
jgi:hypothetical protein